jgi:peroxiredoxin
MFCRELAAQVRGVTPEIERKGARVVFIGNGSPAMAQAFKEDFDVTSALYTDPSLEVYKAAGMKRGMGSLWKTMKRAAGALSEGHVQGRTQGDAFQQGGILVVDRTGDISYAHVSEHAGDHPELSEVVAAVPRTA